MPINVYTVFGFAALTALATGLGALPFLFARHVERRWLGVANALAAGLMVAASLGLAYEGAGFGIAATLAGVALGVGFIWISHRRLARYEHLRMGRMDALDARKVLLVLGVMTIHSFTEGVGVGVSFGGGEALGVFITAAIALHNVPEGLAISLVMVPRGASVGAAFAWSVFSSLPQPLMAVPAYLFVEVFAPFLPVGLGFAAGAMLWMAAFELLPEAVQDSSARAVAVTLVLSVAATLLVQFLLLS